MAVVTDRERCAVVWFRENLAWFFRRKREETGMTVAAVCRVIGIDNSAVCRMFPRDPEKRHVIPTLRGASEITRSCGFDLRVGLLPPGEFVETMEDISAVRKTGNDPVRNFRDALNHMLAIDSRTIEQVGRDCGIPFPHICRIRNEQIEYAHGRPRVLRIDTADRMADALGLWLCEMLLPIDELKARLADS